MLLEGIFAPLTTCFHGDGRPYWHKLEENVEHYSRTPVSGLVLLSSTGEAVMLSDEESREILRVAREAARPEKVLLAGVGRESVWETLRLAEFAAQLDYDAVLVRAPHDYRPQMGHRELLTYYRVVADRSPLPVVLDNIPACAADDLPVAVVAELAMHPNIVGLKESSWESSSEPGSGIGHIRQIVEKTRAAGKRVVTVTQVFAAVPLL
jgi:4-hydroxy-2-oxoglutarate aldolase